MISTYHLSSRLNERLFTAYLEAEDADHQQAILTHPEHIIWDQRDLPEEPYDGRLSDYGNELMHAVMNMWRPLTAVFSTLGDSRIGDLGEREKAIIYPFLGEMNDLTEKIMSATNKL